MQAILIVSHGSRSSKTIDEIQILLGRMKEKIDVPILRYAFLELASPSIPEGIDQCIEEGAKEVYVLLNFLNAGMHVNKDIPEIIEEARQKHIDIPIKVSLPVGQHSHIPNLFVQLFKDLKAHG